MRKRLLDWFLIGSMTLSVFMLGWMIPDIIRLIGMTVQRQLSTGEWFITLFEICCAALAVVVAGRPRSDESSSQRD